MKIVRIIVVMSTMAYFSCTNQQQENQITTTTSEADSTVRTDTLMIHDTITIDKRPGSRPEDFEIVPGNRLGKLYLGDDAGELSDKIGKPDFSDAAMGKAWLRWYGGTDSLNRKTQLDVFTTYRDTSMREKAIKLIRTSSAAFTTPNGVHVYDSLHVIGKKFPALQYVNHYQQQSTGEIISIYDDKNAGIGFEIGTPGEKKICLAIIIHEKGTELMRYYNTFLAANNYVLQNER